MLKWFFNVCQEQTGVQSPPMDIATPSYTIPGFDPCPYFLLSSLSTIVVDVVIVIVVFVMAAPAASFCCSSIPFFQCLFCLCLGPVTRTAFPFCILWTRGRKCRCFSAPLPGKVKLMAVSFVKSIKLSVIWQIVWQQPQASPSFVVPTSSFVATDRLVT